MPTRTVLNIPVITSNNKMYTYFDRDFDSLDGKSPRGSSGWLGDIFAILRDGVLHANIEECNTIASKETVKKLSKFTI